MIEPENGDHAIKCADQGLYEAKEADRNRMVVA